MDEQSDMALVTSAGNSLPDLGPSVVNFCKSGEFLSIFRAPTYRMIGDK